MVTLGDSRVGFFERVTSEDRRARANATMKSCSKKLY